MVSTCFYINLTLLLLIAIMYISADYLAAIILLLECVTVCLIGLFASFCILMSSSSVFIWIFLLIVLGTVEFLLLVALSIFLNKFTKIK